MAERAIHWLIKKKKRSYKSKKEKVRQIFSAGLPGPTIFWSVDLWLSFQFVYLLSGRTERSCTRKCPRGPFLDLAPSGPPHSPSYTQTRVQSAALSWEQDIFYYTLRKLFCYGNFQACTKGEGRVMNLKECCSLQHLLIRGQFPFHPKAKRSLSCFPETSANKGAPSWGGSWWSHAERPPLRWRGGAGEGRQTDRPGSRERWPRRARSLPNCCVRCLGSVLYLSSSLSLLKSFCF